METVAVIWKWLNDNAPALGVLVVVLPLTWSSWSYLRLKRREVRERRFRTYHALIKQLVERDDPNVPKMLDRQIAVIFELRNFEEYFELSRRILDGLKKDWANYGPEDKRRRLLQEIELTLAHIERRI